MENLQNFDVDDLYENSQREMINRLKNGQTAEIVEASGETETFDNDEFSCREGV